MTSDLLWLVPFLALSKEWLFLTPLTVLSVQKSWSVHHSVEANWSQLRKDKPSDRKV